MSLPVGSAGPGIHTGQSWPLLAVLWDTERLSFAHCHTTVLELEHRTLLQGLRSTQSRKEAHLGLSQSHTAPTSPTGRARLRFRNFLPITVVSKVTNSFSRW